VIAETPGVVSAPPAEQAPAAAAAVDPERTPLSAFAPPGVVIPAAQQPSEQVTASPEELPVPTAEQPSAKAEAQLAPEAQSALEAQPAVDTHPAPESAAAAEAQPAPETPSGAEAQPGPESLPAAAEAQLAPESPPEAQLAAEAQPSIEAPSEAAEASSATETPSEATEASSATETPSEAAEASSATEAPSEAAEARSEAAAEPAPESQPAAEAHEPQAAEADATTDAAPHHASSEQAVEPAAAAFQEAPQTPAEPFPHFSSPGSETPVVLSTPVPRISGRIQHGVQALWDKRQELAPRAYHWSQKTLRSAPRALVIGAPFIALFGIWAGHSLVKRHQHAAAAQAMSAPASTALATAEAAPIVAPATAGTPPAPPASAVLSSVTEAPAATGPAAAAADPATLLHALAHGLPALEKLAEKFPDDPQVGLALAGQQAQAQRYDAAVASVEHLLEVAPASTQNGKVMGILWRAAQSPASEHTFVALRKLGGRGTDITFDLATTAGVRDAVRDRARAELSSNVAFDASADTRLASALLLAPDCNARKALLDRAEADGGKRTLIMLERFSRGTGCTSSSEGACNACLMGSPVLAHALAKLNPGAKP
jgi:hypothetical protein